MQAKSLILLSFFFSSLVSDPINAQVKPDTTSGTSGEESDLLSLLNKEYVTDKKEYTSAIFKTTRIANGHSIENTGKGVLDFRVSHRFGRINQGIEDFFGLDNATTRIGFDYGLTNWLMIGIGRSTYLKEFDGFFKTRLFRQVDNDGMPIGLSYMGAISVQANTVPVPNEKEYFFSNRLAYINQLLIARKFNQMFSLQLMPTHVHYNLVQLKDDPNDVIAIGLGGRIKLTNRVAFNGEYYYVVGDKIKGTRNSLTLGFDIETGGHVFQLMFSNSTGITERNTIGMTDGNWADGDIHFGFNISRVFTIVKPKGLEDTRDKVW